jgi:hypothetical protein
MIDDTVLYAKTEEKRSYRKSTNCHAALHTKELLRVAKIEAKSNLNKLYVFQTQCLNLVPVYD